MAAGGNGVGYREEKSYLRTETNGDSAYTRAPLVGAMSTTNGNVDGNGNGSRNGNSNGYAQSRSMVTTSGGAASSSTPYYAYRYDYSDNKYYPEKAPGKLLIPYTPQLTFVRPVAPTNPWKHVRFRCATGTEVWMKTLISI